MSGLKDRYRAVADILAPSWNKVWAVCRKELAVYFASPVAYIVAAVFLLFSGYFFSIILSITREASLRLLFQNVAIVMLLVAPMLTMRLFAEERKLGTFELLVTSPLRISELVAGKFLGAVILFLAIMAVTLEYPLILVVYGEPDWGPMAATYLGFILMGTAFLAIGMFASSLTDNQIVAVVASFGILLFLWIIGWASDLIPSTAIGMFVRSISIIDRFESFSKGVIDTGDLAYYLSVIGTFIFLTIRSLDWRRW